MTTKQKGDALSLFRKAQINMEHGTSRFEAGEHVWLGRKGMAAACKQFNLSNAPFDRIMRHAKDERFTYGELVALSGDFYGSPQDLFEERPSPLPWLYEENDIPDLRKSFEKELAWIENENRGVKEGYPNESIALVWNSKSMIELAMDNNVHFGWHNIVAYCRYHREALALACQADQKDEEDPTWCRALFYNAFADHFLTDAFAAGHIRVPRAEIRDWAKAQGYSDQLAGALSKVLHDQDGHVTTNHSDGEQSLVDEGLRVRNSLGIEWYTRCDGQLFLVKKDKKDSPDPPLIQQPVQAVAESIIELFQARQKRVMPDGIYQALPHVPFPHPDAPTLCDKFGSHMSSAQFDALQESIAWYLEIDWIGPGVDLGEIRTLFSALPELMNTFRQAVKKAYDNDAELQKRLPQDYVEAFTLIH